MLNNVQERQKAWDIVIIGGGATGVGCAIDAASRGFDVLLLEQHDFGKGTSSRSTKLVHGGVRYLEQGNISLVREALKERGILKQNAPHLVSEQAFIIPCYGIWQKLYYGIGLKTYNLLSGKYSFGKSQILSKNETLKKLPNINSKNLTGGISYYDGQFDDTRLLIDLVKTSAQNNATVLNYARVFGLTKDDENKINGVNFECVESGELFSVKTKVVINATGAFCDNVRKFSEKKAEKIISASQGIHLVFDKTFLQSEDAIMIPKTSDERVLFAIPWHNKTLVGTTDTPIKYIELEPKALDEEIEFVLNTCQNYLAKPPKKEDVLSVFVGIRPLVKTSNTTNTASLSRDHTIEINDSNLLTITGGKWTTYRHMAENAINKAIKIGKLPEKKCVTVDLRINSDKEKALEKLIRENPEFNEKLDEEYCVADIIYAVRNEMARTIEDVLARRIRILFLDAKLAQNLAPKVAKIMAQELNKNDDWINEQIKEFEKIVQNYQIGTP